ncbi:MAG: Hsp70 family protein [Verrucomicrobiota bacterium]
MIGIDLGTTHSLVSVLGEKGPEILENEFGDTLTPSVVAVAEDGTILTGRAARDRLIAAPEAGRAFFKRDMGTDAQYSFGGRKWNPIECSAAILREMKRIAELRLGKPVESAVITVPAYFHDPQRQATVDAAKIAGLKVERLVNEPTAAALAWGFQRPGDDSTLMVFDLGGGTFDVTVLEVFDGVVEVKASSGESRLGGEDYTDLLADWLAKKTGLPAAKLKTGRLRVQVETLKRGLSAGLPQEFTWEKGSLWVSPEDFKNATLELTARLWPVVRRCLRDGGITAQHLDSVLLVGGATRMPLVGEGIREMLGCTLRNDLDPDRVVAMGAAVQQALVAGNEAVSDLVLTDVCPHTLGVAVAKALMPGRHESGFFEPLIDRNTTVPVSRSDTFSTLHPEQDELRIEVYQGESRMVKENRKVGELVVKGMKHQPEQRMPGVVEVRFTYDMSGILEVEITVMATGKKTSKIFEDRPGSMTPEQIEAAMRRLAPLKIRPRDLPPHRARLERANRLYAELTGEIRTSLNQLIDQFESALSCHDDKAIAATAEDLDSFLAPFFRSEQEPRN